MDQVLTRPLKDSATQDSAAQDGMARSQRHALTALLAALRAALDGVAVARRSAIRRRRGLLQRKLLLGLELQCKLEEQVLFPALEPALTASHGARPVAGMPDLATAQREIELLRDLSMLVARTASANRDTVVGVLEGLADLHGRRVDALVGSVSMHDVPWASVEREMRGLLGRWRDEVLTDGDIEDEDRDPVGLPPR